MVRALHCRSQSPQQQRRDARRMAAPFDGLPSNAPISRNTFHQRALSLYGYSVRQWGYRDAAFVLSGLPIVTVPMTCLPCARCGGVNECPCTSGQRWHGFMRRKWCVPWRSRSPFPSSADDAQPMPPEGDGISEVTPPLSLEDTADGVLAETDAPWAELPPELLGGVMEALCWHRATSAAVRRTCKAWRHSHDGRLPHLEPLICQSQSDLDELVGGRPGGRLPLELRLRFPTLFSLDLSYANERQLQEPLRSVPASLTALRLLGLGGHELTTIVMPALWTPALARLRTLDLSLCDGLGLDELRGLSALPLLADLRLNSCPAVKDDVCELLGQVSERYGIQRWTVFCAGVK